MAGEIRKAFNWFLAFVFFAIGIITLVLRFSTTLIIDNVWNTVTPAVIFSAYAVWFIVNKVFQKAASVAVDIAAIIVYLVFYLLPMALENLSVIVDPLGYTLRFVMFIIGLIHACFTAGLKIAGKSEFVFRTGTV
jgi:hypothetical protein